MSLVEKGVFFLFKKIETVKVLIFLFGPDVCSCSYSASPMPLDEKL